MKTLESPMNTTLILASEETEKNGHKLGSLHLKVACLPIPPYAQPQQNIGFGGQGKVKNGSGLTICLTGSEKKRKSKRFQRVGHGLFRMRKTGIIYAVFKSAGKTRWKNLGTDDVRQARELFVWLINVSENSNPLSKRHSSRGRQR